MPKQFVSICGMSAAGKKHLIELLTGTNDRLRKRFGLEGTTGVYGQHEKPRIPLKPTHEMLTAPEDCVLFFWQFATHDWIAKVKQAFPSARHRVLLLWRPWHIHRMAFYDAERDPTYRPDERELQNVWSGMIVPRFKNIGDKGIELELVDASTENYDPISWPSCPLAPGAQSVL